eukprot:3937772-Rhodomonas_salina.2
MVVSDDPPLRKRLVCASCLGSGLRIIEPSRLPASSPLLRVCHPPIAPPHVSLLSAAAGFSAVLALTCTFWTPPAPSDAGCSGSALRVLLASSPAALRPNAPDTHCDRLERRGVGEEGWRGGWGEIGDGVGVGVKAGWGARERQRNTTPRRGGTDPGGEEVGEDVATQCGSS